VIFQGVQKHALALSGLRQPTPAPGQHDQPVVPKSWHLCMDGKRASRIFNKRNLPSNRSCRTWILPIWVLKRAAACVSFARMQKSWKSDAELFAIARRELFTAVVGDVMDMMGYRTQFLPPAIQPLRDDMVVIGRAMPVLEADDTGGEGPGRANDLLNRPFGLMLRALDDLQTDEVYLCSGSSPNYALWGELMSMAASNRGAAGAVVDGYSRDTPGILKQNFPTFSHGRYAQDQRPRGKVIDFRCALKVGAVHVAPGDIVFGDLDGVCVVPRAIEREVFEAALQKANGERRVFDAIKSGMGAQEAWDTFGIM
jgi:regulator of RNase E activity RraA